jgi:polyisoprenoid-binding protein YceI
MGKIIVTENISIDGVVEDPTGEEGFRHGGWGVQLSGHLSHSARGARRGIDTANPADARTKEVVMTNRADELFVGRWRLDPQRSKVEFRTGHFWGLMTVKGHFASYEGRLELSHDPAIELTVDPASLQTGNRKRDKHLRSADFFDVENHPLVRFVSESVVLDDETLRVRGRLLARERSVALELDARVRRVGNELQIEASTSAPHRELGMTWSPLGMIRSGSQLLVTGHLVPDPVSSDRHASFASTG